MAFEVFISYSHRDQALRTELDKHLSTLKRQNIITSWYDGNIILHKLRTNEPTITLSQVV